MLFRTFTFKIRSQQDIHNSHILYLVKAAYCWLAAVVIFGKK